MRKWLEGAFITFSVSGSLIVLLTAVHGSLWAVNALFVIWFCSLIVAGVLFIRLHKGK